MTTCLVGYSSIEATPPAAGTTTSQKAARTTPCRRLRIDPSHHTTPVIKTTGHAGHQPPTASWQDRQMGTLAALHQYLLYPILLACDLHYIPFGNQPDYPSTWSFHYHPCTPQYTWWFMSQSMRSNLATIDASIMEVFYFAFSLYSLFFAIYPKTPETLLLCCLYSTGIFPTP